MLDPRFVILGAAINIYGGLVYAWSTFKGKTQPNRVSWILWTVAPFIAFAAELSQGVGLQSLLTFTVGFTPLLVLVASFANPKAYWKISSFDLVCGTMSALALVLWLVTKHGNVAIFFSVLADFLAAVPTIIKCYRFPETENSSVYLASIPLASITLLTIDLWNFETYAFPIYILAVNAVMATLIVFPRLRLQEVK